MDELTLITEEKEYVPETTKPGLPQTEEGWKKVEEERIAWEKAEKIAEGEASGMGNPSKEPWQMTEAEWAKSPQGMQAELTPLQWRLYKDDAKWIHLAHENLIHDALVEGKPVPPEVLADYPDLAISNPGEPMGNPTYKSENKTLQFHGEYDTEEQADLEAKWLRSTKSVSVAVQKVLDKWVVYKVIGDNPGEPIGSNFHSLMLHAVAEMYGPGGIVVDEVKAKTTSCECVEYKPGKYWCTSKGVVGALTDEQEKIYCNPRVMVERPGMKERMTKWAESVEICRAQLPPTDGRTRLEVYLDCMSKELTKAGVED